MQKYLFTIIQDFESDQCRATELIASLCLIHRKICCWKIEADVVGHWLNYPQSWAQICIRNSIFLVAM